METTGYRKAALERLSSPEQVDEILHVSSSKDWIALLAVFMVLGAVGVWAFEGHLPTKAAGQGVIVRTGGVLNVVTLKEGMVLSVHARVGERVKAQQIVARVGQPALVEKIKDAKLGLQQAHSHREWLRQVSINNAKLQADALTLERNNAIREISQLEEQAKLAAEQIPVEEHLLAQGLVTKQQTILAREKLATIQGQIAAKKASIKQLDAQSFAVQAQPEQADAERMEQIRRSELELRSLEKELTLFQNVVSPYSGQVIEMKVDAGSVVQADAPILSIQPNVNTLEVLVCIPSQLAKSIRPGMDAEVSPSSFKREEFGFIRGKVAWVADYPATQASLMRTFQNEALVTSLMTQGPVTEVRVQLQRQEKDPDSFQWSSSVAPKVMVSSGSLCAVDIVTLKQRPISLLLPFLKRKLGMS